MSHQTTLFFTEQIVRQAVYGFWWRTVGAGFIVALALVALGVGLLVALGANTWFVGAAGSVLLMGTVFAMTVYAVHYRASMRRFGEMGRPQATFRVDASTFTVSSDIGTTTLQWSAVKELWQFADVWLLLYSRAQFSTLPVACLSPEMQATIIQRIRASGGRIVGR